jgi:hypothetical protein
MFASGHQAEARKVGKAVGIDNTAPMDAAISGLSSGADVTVVIGTDHGPLPGE